MREKRNKIEQLARERIIPEIDKGGSFFYEHLARYLFSAQFTKGKTVLDAGCGVGYGSFLLSNYGNAKWVKGIDISRPTVRYAKSKYQSPNISFEIGNVEKLENVSSHSVDVVVSFEVIEHLSNQEQFIEQIRRVLKIHGLFIVSTPNKFNYPEGNPFHKKELYPEEFLQLLQKYFKYIKMFEQGFDIAQIIKETHKPSLSFEEEFFASNQQTLNLKNDLNNSQYLIAICSDKDLSKMKGVSININKVNDLDLSKGLISLGEQFDTLKSQITSLNQIVDQTQKQFSDSMQQLNLVQHELDAIRLSKIFKFWPFYCRLRSNYRLIRRIAKIISQNPSKIILVAHTLLTFGSRGVLEKLKYFEKYPDILVQCRLWLEKNYPTEQDLEMQKKQSHQFKYRPKISIITPTYNTPLEYLKSCLESVLRQSYDNWELCIADDASPNEEVRELIKEYAGQNKRIKYIFRQKNGQISQASNSAIKIATGEFVATLDHDDILVPSALFEVVKALNKNKKANFIYSDYAVIDSHNQVHRFGFCPDFSRFYYLSHPYIVHLVVIRKKIVQQINGFDEKYFNGGVSHDVDLFLRAFAVIKDNNILHIPKVLYFWRQYGDSTSSKLQNKVSYYTKKALRRYLNFSKIEGSIKDGLSSNIFRVRPSIKNKPLISIIIPTKDKWKLLAKCIKSIKEKGGYKDYEIIIVQNNTADEEALNYLKNLSREYRVLRYDREFNFGALNNYAANMAKGEYLLLLNDDIEFQTEGFLKSMLELFQFKDVGVVGAKLLYPDNTVQHAGVIIGIHGSAEHWHKFIHAYENSNINFPERGYISSLLSIREYSAVTAACLMTRKNLYEEVGGLSEKMKVGFSDVDYCLKITKRKYKVLFTPYALAYHYEHASRKEVSDKNVLYHPEDIKLFITKWKRFINKGDPYYSPNLSLESTTPIPSGVANH
ncbi:MAG: glycosyltransferase [Candidatus Daviesbacteria bacterium]